MKKKKLYIAAAIIGVIIGVVGYLKFNPGVLPGGVSAETSQAFTKIKGSADSRIQIVEFSDFQCPACQRAQPVLDELYAKYSSDIAIVFKHFPLDGHVWAGVAHQASECANRQGSFWEFHDLLYGGQQSWSGPSNPINTFVRYAKSLNLDMDTFGNCMANEQIMKDILAEKQEGISKKVQSTPTIFINEKRVVGPVQLKVEGEKIIREQLGLKPMAVQTKTDSQDAQETTQ